MRKLIVLCLTLLTIVSVTFAQNWTQSTKYVFDNFSPYKSSSDSIWLINDESKFIIMGAETLRVFIPTLNTLGMLHIKGTVLGLAQLIDANYSNVDLSADTLTRAGDCVVTIKVARHEGDGTGLRTGTTETYYTLATASAGVSAYADFSFTPLENLGLEEKSTQFYTVLFIGTAQDAGQVKLDIDFISAYPRKDY